MKKVNEECDNEMAIIERAEKMGITKASRITHLMDIDYARKAFNIDLDAWLHADDENFIHDFLGIFSNIDRESVNHTHNASEACFNMFVPRFAK